MPVTLGNIVGGVIFTALALYLTYRKKAAPAMEFEFTDAKRIFLEKAEY